MLIKIEENISPIRIDQFLETKLEDKSRSQIQKLISQGHILVNSKPTKKKYLLLPEDEIQINIPQEDKLEIEPIKKPLSIIYQDDDILVIDKPANLSVHQDINKHQKETLINWLIGNDIQLSSIGGEHRPGIVHRLDKDTSGLLIIAKNDKAHHNLQQQFANKEVEKTYLTLVVDQPATPSGTINAPIARDKIDRKKMTVSSNQSARPSVTHFQTIDIYTLPESFRNTHKFSLLKINIETGRTHQIRVHMSSINHPVIGDEKYGSPKLNQIFQTIGLKRQFLHAHKLEFTHPTTGKKVSYISNLPSDLQNTLDKLELN